MMRMTLTTATGRRRALFSPVLERNGTRKRMTMPTTGATRMRTVSMYGGSSAKAENSGRK